MPGGGHDDESNKMFVLTTRDSRVAIGFAGLAEVPSLRFRTREWLSQALADCASPDYSIRGTITRLKSRAERDISRLRLRAEDRRLSITGAGYSYNNGVPQLTLFQLSNFESPDETHTVSDVADSRFQIWNWVAPVDMAAPAGRRISGWRETSPEAIAVWDEIWSWVGEQKPPHAIISRTVKMIRLTADLSHTRGYVGRQCMSVVIPSERSIMPSSQYHTSEVTSTAYMPDFIAAIGPGAARFSNIQIGKSDGISPLAVPQVSRNRPCPCGSGQKYKFCHGKHHSIR
jgi:SEC-C motif-containing protein